MARPIQCIGPGSCQFRALSVAELTEPRFGECKPGTPGCQTTVHPGGREVHRRVDPYLTTTSGRLWPQGLAAKLRDVPPDGLTITADEYERHKEIYAPLLRGRLAGMNFIEDGLLYQHVRVCQIEEGADATCEVSPPLPAVK